MTGEQSVRQDEIGRSGEQSAAMPRHAAAAASTWVESYAQPAIVKSTTRSTVSHVASRLRSMSLEIEAEALLGSEEALVMTLGAARSTVRQAARILEREGLLTVRRGSNGGYFSARPDAATIETAVSAYLDTLSIDIHDIGVVAAALWIEVMRKACDLRTQPVIDFAIEMHARVSKVRVIMPFLRIIDMEHEIRSTMFGLTDSRYIELMFQINHVFSRRRFLVEERIRPSADDQRFVRRWRDSKLMELQAIMDGDTEMGVLAAAHGRALWRNRFFLPTDDGKV